MMKEVDDRQWSPNGLLFEVVAVMVRGVGLGVREIRNEARCVEKQFR